MDANAYSTVFSKGLAIKNKKSFLALGFLSIGFFIAWVAYTQWQTTIASYTQDLGIPIDRYSVLWTINGAMIIAGQPLMKLITRWITSPKMQIVVGNTIFLGSFIYILKAESFADFATGMVILTFGEMFVWPAVPTIAGNLAPKGRTGFYQGIINSVATAGKMTGPAFGGLIVDYFSIQVLFGILALLLLLPFLSVYLLSLAEKRIEVASESAG